MGVRAVEERLVGGVGVEGTEEVAFNLVRDGESSVTLSNWRGRKGSRNIIR